MPPAVAPGGRLIAQLSVGARLQQRAHGHWVGRPRSFRVTTERGVLVFRARNADSNVTRPMSVRVRPLTLDAVGDVNLGDAVGEAITRNGPAYPWRSVGPTLRKADIAVANLECVIGVGGAPVDKTSIFQASPLSVPAAAHAGGLDVVSAANNHAGDFGDQALLNSLRTLRHNHIATFGAGADRDSALRATVLTRLGLRVAFVGFSTVAPRSFAATTRSPGIAWGRADLVRRAVRRAARRADVVVAFFHWGVEAHRLEDAHQRRLASTALKAGATVVLGAHPHVLQPIRRPPGKIIAYSLGNFVFHPREPGTSKSGILHVALGRHQVISARLQRVVIAGTQPRLRDAS